MKSFTRFAKIIKDNIIFALNSFHKFSCLQSFIKHYYILIIFLLCFQLFRSHRCGFWSYRVRIQIAYTKRPYTIYDTKYKYYIMSIDEFN